MIKSCLVITSVTGQDCHNSGHYATIKLSPVMAYPTDALAAQTAAINISSGAGAQTVQVSVPSAPPPQAYGYPAPQQYAPQGGQPSPQQQHYPPPGAYQQQQYQQYPPPQGPPPPQAAPAAMPPAQGVPPGPPVMQSAPPSGFVVMDAFRNGNVVQLINRGNGNPVCFDGELKAAGKFNNKKSNWLVIIETNNTVVLQNNEWAGCHINIKGKSISKGKADKHSQLVVHILPDNYVYLESKKEPGSFLGFKPNGVACNPKDLSPSDTAAQFFVRTERQKHPYSQAIMTPFQRPSVFARLMDRSVVQLYHKETATYMSISPGGDLTSTKAANDRATFFIWMDRGMGIVSLQCYSSAGYRLKMTNFQLGAKGEQDINCDFRVMENSDGSISLESVTCPSGFALIRVGARAVKELSVFLVTIQKFGSSETVTKVPIN